MKILVIRNDKLGDFVQAFPAFAMLKVSNPELKLTALVLRTTKRILVVLLKKSKSSNLMA